MDEAEDKVQLTTFKVGLKSKEFVVVQVWTQGEVEEVAT